MTKANARKIEYLTPTQFVDLAGFWRESFPAHPMSFSILKERVFDPRDYHPRHALCYRAENGTLIALSLLVPPAKGGAKNQAGGGIRWFGVHPEYRYKGLGTRLLEESAARLKKLGAGHVDFLRTPPYYIQPGVDTRQLDVISWLIKRGFGHADTHFNMTVDLGRLDLPGRGGIFAADAAGYTVRRAEAADRPALEKHFKSHWDTGWLAETLQAFGHNPVSLFLAVKPTKPGSPKEEIAGFAAYEVNQCPGCFGPTGVAPGHQGHGLGKRLLYAALMDFKELGREECEIGWIGPPDFYFRAVGARLGPTFWVMRKELRKPGNSAAK
ncbi:GNAT family N-acetyltransferase [Candidatus Sumerlaeota bacterium]|nr:GNAT family N-acetyltransferase [Candidatus Sumerlaeota bacterium]